MIPLKDKRGFIDLELNWTAFVLLAAVGLVVVTLMFSAWSKMDFATPIVTKIIVYIGIFPVCYVFTRMWFD